MVQKKMNYFAKKLDDKNSENNNNSKKKKKIWIFIFIMSRIK